MLPVLKDRARRLARLAHPCLEDWVGVNPDDNRTSLAKGGSVTIPQRWCVVVSADQPQRRPPRCSPAPVVQPRMTPVMVAIAVTAVVVIVTATPPHRQLCDGEPTNPGTQPPSTKRGSGVRAALSYLPARMRAPAVGWRWSSHPGQGWGECTIQSRRDDRRLRARPPAERPQRWRKMSPECVGQ